MAINRSPSQIATNALQAISFGSIIGGPLNACIEAQAMAAKRTWEFIQEVGLKTDTQTGKKSIVTMSFSFLQNGRIEQINIPLLTLVPIPYIAIHTIDINFKANISASSSTSSEHAESTSKGGELGGSGGLKVGPFSMEAKMNANYSSKKDSKATSESKYCVEYTMDVSIKAGQDSMPVGLAKVLQLLGNSVDVSDPEGTLEVNSTDLILENGVATLVATYKDSSGLLNPGKLTIRGKGVDVNAEDFIILGDSRTINLNKVGEYIVEAEEKSVTIKAVEGSMSFEESTSFEGVVNNNINY